ncbi:hypothetical protein Lfu02_03210 [Longispora fulva]|uniref:Uncharacterized protein n=1 Tax=Longispora fulva TaxID=619741 RepID=A0A8J7GPW8_9ACTN|nr:hypothetical protein [Longispora fulva]MBG6135808.1 hypothetical protein [Longispora fulva]GIG55949.1 hypothetical protein Lfu02_03210 [Longispora fulva]
MRWFFRYALLSAAYGSGVLLWTLIPRDHPVPTAAWTAAFVSAFVSFGPGVILTAVRQHSMVPPPPPPGIVNRTHTTLAWCVSALAVVAVLAVVVTGGMLVPNGQPEIVTGQYVLNNHGSTTPITEAQYTAGLAAGQRLFTIGATAFSLAGMWLLLVTTRLLAEDQARNGSTGRV